MPDTQQPFGEEIHSAEIVPMNRVEAMASLARQSFQNCIAEYGGEEKMKEMKRQANAALKIPIDDVSALETVKKAKMLYVKARTSLDKTKDLIKRDIIDAGKAVELIRGEFGAPFSVWEEKLAARQKEIEDLKAAKEQAELRAKEELKRTRIAKVEEAGAKFTGQWWAINDISVGAQMLEEMPDDLFGDLLGKIKVQFDLNEATRIAKEKADQEERAALEAERERQRKEKEEMEAERERMRKEKEEMEAERERMRKEKEEAEAAKAKQEREAEEARRKAELDAKIAPFVSIGFQRAGDVVIYRGGHYEWSFSVGDIDKIAIQEAEVKKAEVDAKWDEWKEAQLKFLKDKEAEAERLRKEALDDKQKVKEWLASIKAIELPVVKDRKMKAIVGGVVDYISDNIEKLGLA